MIDDEDEFSTLREEGRKRGINERLIEATIINRRDRGLGDIPSPGGRNEIPWYGNQHTKPLQEPEPPFDAASFCGLRGGTIHALEHYAARRAAEEAIKEERAYWLPKLEQWLVDELTSPTPGLCGGGLVKEHPIHDSIVLTLRKEIARIKRALGDRQSPEAKRAATRERVRRFRAEHRAKL